MFTYLSLSVGIWVRLLIVPNSNKQIMCAALGIIMLHHVIFYVT